MRTVIKAPYLVTDTKVPLSKDHFWHLQIKTEFKKKIMRQGSVPLPDIDFFWIIPCPIKMKLSQKLVCCMKNICNMFLA